MNSKTKKMIWGAIVLLCYAVLIILTIFDKLPKKIGAQKIATIFSLSTALIMYGYNHWQRFFISWRKLMAFIWEKTVTWEAKYVFYVEADQNFTEIAKKFKTYLVNEEKFKVQKSKIQNERAEFSIMTKAVITTVILTVNPINGADEFRLAFTSSAAYKESKLQIKNFEVVLNDLMKVMPPLIDVSELEMADSLKAKYSVKIQLGLYNPFYRLTLNHVDSLANQPNWNLKLVEDKSLTVRIQEHTMSATSTDKDKILNVLKEYVAVATVG